VEDQALHVVSDVNEADLRLGSLDAVDPDEQPHSVLLLSRYVLDRGPHPRLGRVAPADMIGHGPTRRLLAMDPDCKSPVVAARPR